MKPTKMYIDQHAGQARMRDNCEGVFVMRRNATFTMWAMLAITIIAVALAIRATADEPAATPAPAPTGQLFIYSGILRSVDLHARTIIVDGSPAQQQFTVPTDAEIIVKDKPRGSLDNLMVGDGIQIKYTDDDGVHVAHQISLLSLKAP
jgi:hypothetical protein